LSVAAAQARITGLLGVVFADRAEGTDGGRSSTKACLAPAVAVLDQVVPALTVVVIDRFTAEPLAIPDADATFIEVRMQKAVDAPGSRVPVRGTPAADAQVVEYAPAGTVASAVHDAVLAVGHAITEIAPASGAELPGPSVATDVTAVVTLPVFVTRTPPVVVVRPDRKTTSRGGAIVSVTETVPAVTIPASVVAAPFHRA
jgi:hypothetical protein